MPTLTLAAWLVLAAPEAHGDDLLTRYNSERIELNTWGMVVLLGWAVANLGVGTAFSLTTTGRTRYLHQGNAAWNVVNLAIAGAALWGLCHEDPALLDAAATLEKAHQLEWLLWLNSGLDLAYMASGAWLWERGLHRDSARLVGYGQALILQGGFLLLFDLTLLALNVHASAELLPRLVAGSTEAGARTVGLLFTW